MLYQVSNPTMARDSIFVFEDRILTIEAEEAAKEIAFAVKDVKVSQALPYTRDLVYLNLTTQENKRFCIELSSQGFRVSHHIHYSLWHDFTDFGIMTGLLRRGVEVIWGQEDEQTEKKKKGKKKMTSKKRKC